MPQKQNIFSSSKKNYLLHTKDYFLAKNSFVVEVTFKIRNYVNLKILRSIYFGIFESLINYSSLVWVQNSGSIKHP